MEDGALSGARYGDYRGVLDETSLGAARNYPHPTPGGGPDLSVFFPSGTDAPQVPSGGIPGGL